MKDIFYLAPIRGVTDMIYRNAFTDHFTGFDLAVAPFISEKRSKKTSASIIKDISKDLNKMQSIPQILEREPARFIQLAELLVRDGHECINWNMGCPFPKVLGKGKGSAILPYPGDVDSFLQSVTESVEVEISVKCRLGLEKDDDIFSLIPVFNRYRLREIIIHPRTAKQMYEGRASTDIFEKCLELAECPVVYNGDIFSRDDYLSLKERFPSVNRWMIGRGVLRNPFLLREIRTGEVLPASERLSIMRKFHDTVFDEYSELLSGPAHITDKMKGVWNYLSEGFENSAKIMKRIKKTQNEGAYLDAVDDLFSSNPELRI